MIVTPRLYGDAHGYEAVAPVQRVRSRHAPVGGPVQRLGVVGSGFMGSGIAGTAVAQAGVDVRLRDTELGRVGAGLRAPDDANTS